MALFATDTIEGVIERKYMPSLIEAGATEEVASEKILHYYEKSKGIPYEPNAGDMVLEVAKTDDATAGLLNKVRQHGVRDEDIRSWYSMHPFEKVCLCDSLEELRTATFITQLELGKTGGDAAIIVYQYFPRLVEASELDNDNWGGDVRGRLTDEDRPLPIELFNVISDYLAVMRRRDPTYQERMLKATSFNALIREAIQNGELHTIAAELSR